MLLLARSAAILVYSDLSYRGTINFGENALVKLRSTETRVLQQRKEALSMIPGPRSVVIVWCINYNWPPIRREKNFLQFFKSTKRIAKLISHEI